MTRLGEARAQLQQACKAVTDDRPELAASLAEIMADVDELRWMLSEGEATGQSRGDDRKEKTESERGPK